MQYLLLTLTFFMAANGFAGTTQDKAKERMLSDIDIIKNTFEIMYAPADWKKIYTDWDLQEEVDLAKVKVLETEEITVKDYQRILLAFFNSMKDYHVGVTFFSTEMAVLPFRVHSTNGKYYIAWVMDPLFKDLDSPMKAGDEVVLFDGRPVDEVVQELKKSEFGNPLSATDQALAEAALTMRSGTGGNIVPKGPASLTVRHAGTDKTTTYDLTWFYFPEEITSSLSPLLAAEKAMLLRTDGARYYVSNSGYKKPLGESPFFFKEMTASVFSPYTKAVSGRKRLLGQELEKRGFHAAETEEDSFIAAKTSFVPPLGEMVWEAPSIHPYHAYIYLDELGRKIGYVRIPHYSAGSQSAEKFAELMRTFERRTDALVVDQLNNPGGNIFYMLALASMLTDRPLEAHKHRMTLTQEDIYFAVENVQLLQEITTDEEAQDAIGSNISGYYVDFDLAQQLFKNFSFIISEWKAGRQFTDADYLYGIDYLKPHPRGHYSKPILVLVNELDFSCGDFLPAILQDNGRAVIMGTRTAGAGGYVLRHSYPNLFGMEGFSFTGSIAQRLDMNPLENLGVIPDIIVERTEKDLEGGHADYKAQVQKAVSELLK